jgi:anti-sigma-K factor RskA
MSDGAATFDWQEPYNHSMALLAVASKDPALAMILNHQHDCIEALKEQMGKVPGEMRMIVREEFKAVATEREQSWGAWWRATRGWITTVAAVSGATAAIYSALFHH